MKTLTVLFLLLSSTCFGQLTKVDSLQYRIAYLEQWVVDLEDNTRIAEWNAAKDNAKVQKQITAFIHYTDSMAVSDKRRNRKFWRSLGEFVGGVAKVLVPGAAVLNLGK